MAEAITYADLRFVKAPLKNSISSHLGQDSEVYEDGELTYENVQVVSSVSGGLSGLASSVLVDKAAVLQASKKGAGGHPKTKEDASPRSSRGVKSEPTTCWSSVTPPAARRTLPCPTDCLQYFLLGLLLACLMLGVAAICLGVRYLQVSQQFQRMTRVLEATNSSLWQQLREKAIQLGQKEEDLKRSKEELVRSQEALQEKQRNYEVTEQQLRACQSEAAKNLTRERALSLQRLALNQRLTATRDTLKSFFSCPSSDTCCPLGWILHKKRCFYISPTKKTLEESQKHCASLSSKLAVPNEVVPYPYSVSQQYSSSSLTELAYEVSDSYWIDQQDSRSSQHTRSKSCTKLQSWSWKRVQSSCAERHPCICELEVYMFPDEDYSLL